MNKNHLNQLAKLGLLDGKETWPTVSKFSETYPLGKVLGAGSSGIVIKIKNNEDIVLKLFIPNDDTDVDVDSVVETNALAALSSESCAVYVPCYEDNFIWEPKSERDIPKELKTIKNDQEDPLFAPGRQYYGLVSNYVKGEDMQELIDRWWASHSYAPPLEPFAELLLSAAEALLFLHRQDFVHRDIKPDNIRVSSSAVVLIDLGFACHGDVPLPFSSSCQGSTFVGTPMYMAPDVLRAAQVDNRVLTLEEWKACDVYSLGKVFEYLATGEVPFAGVQNLNEWAEILMNLPDEPKGTIVSGNEELDHLLKRMLAVDWTRRPTIEQVWLTLKEMKEGDNGDEDVPMTYDD